MSKAARVYTLKSKTEIYRGFIEFINTVENITGKKIKRLKCDNGKQYVKTFSQREGNYYRCMFTVCTSAEWNRCLLSRVNRRFSPEIIKTAA